MSHNKPLYIGYDYKEIQTDAAYLSMYIDGYANFGWSLDDNLSPTQTSARLKRNRKIRNKAELTRLQRHFESCLSEIKSLENSKTAGATMYAIMLGLLGTCFMAGSVFAVTHHSPLIFLAIIFGILGILGWSFTPILFKKLVKYKTNKFKPIIELKYDEIDEICEKGNRLLY